MPYYSKRMRVVEREEKRIIKRIILALGATAILLLMIIFAGIPALLSLGSFFNNLKGGQQTVQQNAPLIAPRLEPLDTATNSAKINVVGFGQEGQNVYLFVNN